MKTNNRISFEEMKNTFEAILLHYGFGIRRAGLCADLFAKASLDGVASHGLNWFPEFLRLIEKGLILPDSEPELLFSIPVFERWDGQLGPGNINAHFAMGRAITMAKDSGIGCVALRNTNHWLRAGNYGWQAAEAGCIGICFTNTIPNMPAWGGNEPKLGNNPLVIAVPKGEGAVVLDIAMSQFSYGKMNNYLRNKKDMPYDAGFDENGNVTRDPSQIISRNLALPMGLWKGAGLSFMLDIIACLLSEGRSTGEIGKEKEEYGVSQLFICIYPPHCGMEAEDYHPRIEQIIADLKSSGVFPEQEIHFPGEKSFKNRQQNLQAGVPVDAEIWNRVKEIFSRLNAPT